MDWQIPIVVLIVAACGYYAFRAIRKDISGKCNCPGCPDANKKKTVSIEPMDGRK